MKRRRRHSIAFGALIMLLAACGPKVSFFGDSELFRSADKVVAAQTGAGMATSTVVYASIGCGLMPSGDTADCPAGATQAAVNSFWRTQITADIASGAPAYVQVELGIDDGVWQTPATLAGYKKRIERFVSWLPAGVPVLWDNIPAMAPVFETNFRIVNKALARAAAETPNLHVVDLRTAFTGHWPAWFESDQLHYNDAGEFAFALVNCQALNAVSAALDPAGVGIDAPCDPNYGLVSRVSF